MRSDLKIADSQVAAGKRLTINIPVAGLYTHTEMTMPVHVLRGRRPGPRLFVCAAIHGDEIIGVEIIRRLLKFKILKQLRGSLIAVPIVNIYGFINNSRYLPDRRDLNRFFPGSEKGSLTSRLANIFMKEIVANSTHGIDLHAGSHHRINLPQIRASLDDPETKRLAMAFGDLDDPLLQALSVDSVEPEPGGGALVVTVCLPPDAPPDDERYVLRHIDAVSGRLRSEVAAAIHRKKTPRLSFRVVSGAYGDDE